jgi:glycerophosphoryl diester phosphodiesterase
MFRPPYPHRPLNIGHRGAAGLAPENTLAAFQAGVAAGAHGVELDVQRTRDGHLVVFHDDDLQRIAGVRGSVVTSTLDQLRELDVGRHFAQHFAGEAIPTLDQVIESLPPPTLINIEGKRFTMRNDGLEAAIIQAVHRHDLLDRCLVSSFNPLILWRIGRMDRSIPLGLLYEPGMSLGLGRGWPRRVMPLAALHPYFEQLTPDLVSMAHDHGWLVNTWTVDDPQDMTRLIDMGVDGIITNRPDLLSAALDSLDS